MARLLTSGFETGAVESEGLVLTASPIAPTVVASPARSGGYALSCDSGASNSTTFATWSFTATLTRDYFARAWVRFSTAPATNAPILRIGSTNSSGAYLRLNTDRTVTLHQTSGATQIGSASAALAVDTWHLVQLRARITSGTTADGLEGWVNGVQLGTSNTANLLTTATGQFVWFGWTAVPGANKVIYYDDCAVNDDQGIAENTFPADTGKVLLLKPTSDNTLGTGWEAPQTTGADTTNIYDAVDNTPPQGVAHSDTDVNNLKYIFNAASNNTTNYDANATDYTTAGIGASDTIQLAQAIVNTGSSSTTATSGAVKLVSNPADAGETTLTYAGGAIAGTFPTGWHTIFGALVYAPSVALGTSPVVRVGKRTATTRVAMVDLLGVVVEYVPSAVGPVTIIAQSAVGVAGATGALTVAPTVVTTAATGSATGTLALHVPAAIIAQSATGVAGSTATLTVRPILPLGTAAGAASATAVVDAPLVTAGAEITAQTAAGAAGATATLTVAPTVVAQTATGVATATAALSVAPTVVTAAATGVASTRNVIFGAWLNAATGTATATAALTIAPTIVAGTATAVASTGSLGLSVPGPAPITAQTAVATASGTLTLRVAPTVVMGTATAVASTAAALTIRPLLPLGTAAASATSSATLTTPQPITIPAAPAVGVASAAAALTVRPLLPLTTTAIGTATATLTVRVFLAGTATGTATATLDLEILSGVGLLLAPLTLTAGGTLALRVTSLVWDPSADDNWHGGIGADWPETSDTAWAQTTDNPWS